MAYFRNFGLTYIPRPIPEEPGVYPPIPPQPEPTDPGSTPAVIRPTFSGGSSINLYTNTDDNNVVDKNPSLVATVTVAYNQAVDILNPIIIVESSSDLSGCNYAYISDLGRYYFIDSIALMQGGMYQLSMHVDVLMTYASDIKDVNAVISRQENDFNLYLPDPEFKVYAYTDKKTLKFSKNPFTKAANYLLTVSGGD